jgi:DNA repair protein RadC
VIAPREPAPVYIAESSARTGAGGLPRITRAEDVAVLCAAMTRERVEVLRALLLNARHDVIRRVTVSRGGLSSAHVHPREVFRPAILASAAAIIVVHNHPSGDPEPSVEDAEVTKRLARAGELLGIPLLDHVIVARAGRYVSLRERGMI